MERKFNENDFKRMNELLSEMLLANSTITNKLGTPLDVVALLHTTTPNTLNEIRKNLSRKINDLEEVDEWTANDGTQKKLEVLKRDKEVVNLIIGYKYHLAERSRLESKKSELKEQIEKLKEANKTPAERLKELEDQLNALA